MKLHPYLSTAIGAFVFAFWSTVLWIVVSGAIRVFIP